MIEDNSALEVLPASTESAHAQQEPILLTANVSHLLHVCFFFIFRKIFINNSPLLNCLQCLLGQSVTPLSGVEVDLHVSLTVVLVQVPCKR